MKEKIVLEYSAFFRCLGCDHESLDTGSFFTHLNGHRKNLTGTKRKFKNKENEYLALLQLSLISSEDILKDLHEDDLPQWVLGTKNNLKVGNKIGKHIV